MSKSKKIANVAAEYNNQTAVINDTNAVSFETTTPEATPAPAEVKELKTKVEDRLYTIVHLDGADKFKGKQRQMVLRALLELKDAGTEAATISTIASLCGDLVAKGGIEPSVRYHLHHLTLDGFTTVVNPTTVAA